MGRAITIHAAPISRHRTISSDRSPRGDELGQLARLESLEPRPQSDVRGVRDLGLHRDEVLDFFTGRGASPLQEVLTME
jgi:hypothetical protein